MERHRVSEFVKANYHHMTNREMAAALGVTLSHVRQRAYELKLRRMDLEFWTDEQFQFVVNNYRHMGDVELAEEMNKRWFKKKGWTHKHVEKKRRQNTLKRTEEEKAAIKVRNTKQGRFSVNHWKRWAGRTAPQGTIRMRYIDICPVAFIKVGNKFVPMIKHIWEQANGPVPEGCIVCRKDKSVNDYSLNNLQLMTKADYARTNLTHDSDRYIAATIARDKDFKKELLNYPELLELKRQQLKLQRKINYVRENP